MIGFPPLLASLQIIKYLSLDEDDDIVSCSLMRATDTVTISMMRSAMPVIFGFFLGFLFNTVIYVIPQYMDIRSVMISPARANISAHISQIIPNSFMKVCLDLVDRIAIFHLI